jgi:hypothetical protein
MTSTRGKTKTKTVEEQLLLNLPQGLSWKKKKFSQLKKTV